MFRSKYINVVNVIAVFGLLLGSTAASVDGSSGVSHPAEVDSFSGRYMLIKDETEELKQAINRATDTMSFLRRRVARRQLSEKLPLYPTVSMGRTGENFRTSLSDKAVLSLPLSGAPVLWKAPFGETVRARLRPGRELLEVFDLKQGHCEHLYQLSPDRRILTVSIKVTSRELPKPIEYQLVYRRA